MSDDHQLPPGAVTVPTIESMTRGQRTRYWLAQKTIGLLAYWYGYARSVWAYHDFRGYVAHATSASFLQKDDRLKTMSEANEKLRAIMNPEGK